MTVRVLLTYVIIVLLATAAATASPAESAGAPQETASAQTELEKAASRVRGLKFNAEVDYQVVDRSGVQDLLVARMNEELPPGQLEKISVAYAKLGLVEAGVNLRDLLVALYSEQLAAFYDQKKKKLYSVEGLPFSDAFKKVLMIHELTHALQDQNFDLSTLPLECKNNDDIALAALSLVEGDATLVLTQYMREGARLGLKDILSSVTMGQKQILEAPRVIRKNLLFPYAEGVRFVTELFRDGGWETVNRAYKDLPQSTEQILHPEKYSDKRDDPVPIVLPDFSSVAGKNWDLLENNVLGELNTRILFTEFLGSIRAIRPSRGWGGDRFHVYRVENGNETLLIWATAWDTEKDREEFVSYYLKAVRKKYKEKEFTTIEGKDYVSLTSADVVIWLGWAEKRALVLEAPDDATLLAMVWEFLRAGGGPGFAGGAESPDRGKR